MPIRVQQKSPLGHHRVALVLTCVVGPRSELAGIFSRPLFDICFSAAVVVRMQVLRSIHRTQKVIVDSLLRNAVIRVDRLDYRGKLL